MKHTVAGWRAKIASLSEKNGVKIEKILIEFKDITVFGTGTIFSTISRRIRESVVSRKIMSRENEGITQKSFQMSVLSVSRCRIFLFFGCSIQSFFLWFDYVHFYFRQRWIWNFRLIGKSWSSTRTSLQSQLLIGWLQDHNSDSRSISVLWSRFRWNRIAHSQAEWFWYWKSWIHFQSTCFRYHRG